MDTVGVPPQPPVDLPGVSLDREVLCQNGSNGSEIQPLSYTRKPTLPSLQIPSRTLDSQVSSSARVNSSSVSSPGSARGGLPPRPNLTRTRMSFKGLIPQLSFKVKNPTLEGEKTNLLHQGTPSEEHQDKPSTLRSISLTRMFNSPSTNRTHSLPVTPVTTSASQITERHVIDLPVSDKEEMQKHMKRSYSVPGNKKSRNLGRLDSLRGKIRVIPVTPHPIAVEGDPSGCSTSTEIATEEDGEDIPEEEAVCRICFVELTEGGETLKMECSCKGELALVHQECVVKWFNIKGNRTCDIWKQDVENLPVTLLRIQNPQVTYRHRPSGAPQNPRNGLNIYHIKLLLRAILQIVNGCNGFIFYFTFRWGFFSPIPHGFVRMSPSLLWLACLSISVSWSSFWSLIWVPVLLLYLYLSHVFLVFYHP